MKTAVVSFKLLIVREESGEEIRNAKLRSSSTLAAPLMLKAWPIARNTSTQHLATLLHDVATFVERAGQTHATFSTQHVAVYVPRAPGTQQVDLARMLE